MELRVLGCHGGETPKHKTSSFLIDGDVAIDAGAVTSMLTLEEQKAVETVLVSHAHLDHIKDLATLADNRCQQGGPPINVVGIPATIDILRAHFFNDLLWPDFSTIDTPLGPTLRYTAIEPGSATDLGTCAVQPVMVNHTIDTCGFVIERGGSRVAYSGDTGPTDRFWEVLREDDKLTALLMEVSFPDEHHELAHVSGHHTPETLERDLAKLGDNRRLPILLYHIKPVFEATVEKQLTKLRGHDMAICRLGDQYIL
jgi:3',5'-cyclic-nucleotide phosphodiesterase